MQDEQVCRTSNVWIEWNRKPWCLTIKDITIVYKHLSLVRGLMEMHLPCPPLKVHGGFNDLKAC